MRTKIEPKAPSATEITRLDDISIHPAQPRGTPLLGDEGPGDSFAKTGSMAAADKTVTATLAAFKQHIENVDNKKPTATGLRHLDVEEFVLHKTSDHKWRLTPKADFKANEDLRKSISEENKKSLLSSFLGIGIKKASEQPGFKKTGIEINPKTLAPSELDKLSPLRLDELSKLAINRTFSEAESSELDKLSKLAINHPFPEAQLSDERTVAEAAFDLDPTKETLESLIGRGVNKDILLKKALETYSKKRPRDYKALESLLELKPRGILNYQFEYAGKEQTLAQHIFPLLDKLPDPELIKIAEANGLNIDDEVPPYGFETRSSGPMPGFRLSSPEGKTFRDYLLPPEEQE